LHKISDSRYYTVLAEFCTALGSIAEECYEAIEAFRIMVEVAT
jgi:hypothetical protein